MASQKKRPNQSWEDLANERIREAQDAGEFDALPGFGRPIPGIGEPHDDLWWVKHKLKREQISYLPPSLAIKKDVEDTLQRIAGFTREVEVQWEIVALNARLREANLRSYRGPPSSLFSVDEERSSPCGLSRRAS